MYHLQIRQFFTNPIEFAFVFIISVIFKHFMSIVQSFSNGHPRLPRAGLPKLLFDRQQYAKTKPRAGERFFKPWISSGNCSLSSPYSTM